MSRTAAKASSTVVTLRYSIFWGTWSSSRTRKPSPSQKTGSNKGLCAAIILTCLKIQGYRNSEHLSPRRKNAKFKILGLCALAPLREIFLALFAPLRPILEKLQRGARHFDGLLLGFEERLITKAKLAIETFVGDRHHCAGLLAAHLGDREKRGSNHVDARDLLLAELLNQFRSLLKQRVGSKDPT